MTVLHLAKTEGPLRGRRTQDSRARLLVAARKLFVERGYHATRPQDVSREAGLGHGTFYLHFADKQACFLAFTEEARSELDAYVRRRVQDAPGLEGAVRASLEAIQEYSAANPGVLVTAMADATVIAADDAHPVTLVDRWATQWSTLLRLPLQDGGQAMAPDEAGIIGAAVVGIIHEGSAYAHRHGLPPAATIDLLTRLIVKALT
jgi:AcrR family transcriptional regulator